MGISLEDALRPSWTLPCVSSHNDDYAINSYLYIYLVSSIWIVAY